MIKASKKIISFFLCAIISYSTLLCGLTASATERAVVATESNNYITWTLFNDGELHIEGIGSLVSTPWENWYSSIKKITISKETKAGSSMNFYFDVAVGYPELEFISVEEGNTDFYADENGVLYNRNKTKLYLFPNASDITEYTIPDTVTEIVKGAFCGSKSALETVNCGSGLKTVGANAFYCSDGLKTVNLPDGLATVGNYAFYKCSDLESVSIPDSVTSIGTRCFSSCAALKSASIGSGVKSIPNEAFMDCAELETLTVKGGEAIGASAFENCTSLKNLTVPEGVVTVSQSAFENCTALESVTLPSTLTYIGMGAFKDCTAITNCYFGGDEGEWCSIIFTNYSANPLRYADNFYINNELVTDLVIPEGITTIKVCSFGYYEKLRSVVIPDTVKEIGNSAFYGCVGLESVTMSDSVTSIGDQVFQGCEKLNNIIISDNLEHIGTYAFAATGYYNDYANWDNGFLYLGNCLLATDEANVSADCRLYSKTKLIASQAFKGNKTVTSITMPENVEYIDDFAFTNCKNLKEITLSPNLKSIGASAFSTCEKLEEITIPDSVETIGVSAFYNCSSLTEIEVPASVKTLPATVFFGCANLSKVTLNEGVENISTRAFAGTKVAEIRLPSSVTSFSVDSFKDSSLTDIYFCGSKADWKRATQNKDFGDITIHYTLSNDDKTVIINHTDADFDYEAGNVHLVVSDLSDITPSFDRNTFYNRYLVKPIQVLDIKLVDGDGNPIQPLSDETITVKIKATDEFMNLMKSGLSDMGEYDVEAKEIGFADDCFVFESNGQKISVAANEKFLKKFRIFHWYSDAADPTDYECFTHDKITVENGYIILETSHFSEYAVCTDISVPESFSVKWIVDGVVTEQTVTQGDALSAPANPEKEGHTFVGWSSAVPDTMPAENLEFTAQWQVNKYTITFDTEGGNEIAAITLEYGATITAPENPEKAGYTFIGWLPEIPDTMPANGITVVAQYEKTETPEIPENPETPAATATGIKIISAPGKTKYAYKVDSLDLSGIAVKLTYSDGTSKIITDTDLLKAYGFSADSVGTKTITVAHGGYTASFEITVSYTWWQMIIRILLLGFLWY